MNASWAHYIIRVSIVYCLFSFKIVCLYGQHPAFINFTELNGLPSNEAYYVLQDHDGFIWITTDNGVVKFDGLNFLLYNKQNGLADNVNFSIHRDQHDRLWFRSFTGALSYYQQGAMYRFSKNKSIQEQLGKSIIFSMSFDKYDSLHIGMTDYVLHMDKVGNYRMQVIPKYTLLINNFDGGEPVIAYRNAPGKINQLIFNGKAQAFKEYDDSANFGGVNAISMHGKIYASNDKYLVEVSEQSNKIILEAKNQIISISKDGPDRLWIGLQSGGVLCYANNEFSVPDYLKAVQGLSVTSVLQDSNGGYWISTLERGVFYYPNTSIINYSYPSISKLGAVAFDDRFAYFGNYDGSLYKFSIENKNIELVKRFGSPITSIYYNAKGDNLFVSTPSSTFIFDVNNWKSFAQVVDVRIRGLKKFQDINSKIVGGNFIGLFYFGYDGKFLSYKRTPIKIRNFLFVDSMIYLASASGLIRTNSTLSPFDTLKKLDNYKITDIKSNKGNVLIATAESGLLRLDKDMTTPYYKNGRSPCPLVRMVCLDKKHIFMATQCGLVIDEINRTETLSSLRILDSRSGLVSPNIEFLGFVAKSLVAFSPEGISVIDTTNLKYSGLEPKFYQKKISINNKSINSIGSVLSFNQNNIEFEYGFISFNNRNIQVRHRPSPAFEWSTGNASKVNYYSLSPGFYHPEIEYSINNGPWQNVKLSLPFTISPPWWESIYFLILSVLLIASIVGLSIYVFFQKKVAKLKYQESLREEKDRISRELHDNIGSRLAYIKLSLHNLNAVSGFGKKEHIVDQLNAVVHDLRDTIWTINKDFVSLQDFVERVKNLTTRFQLLNFNISFNFENETNSINPYLNSGAAFNMYRIIQEGLNNCIKHSGAETICVHLKFTKQNKLCVIIKDNGVGFNVDGVNNIDGYGLLSVRARAEEMQAQLEISSMPDMGTEIKLIYAVG